MRFYQTPSEVFVPDHAPEEKALARTTHLCFSAHQDDIEIMAAQPIIECFQQNDKWFTGVVVTDGRSAPRDASYRHCSDEEMHRVCFAEFVGKFVQRFAKDVQKRVNRFC